MKRFLTLLAFLAGANSAFAADYVFGLGTSEFNRNGADSTSIFSAEIHGDPIFRKNRFSLSVFGVATVHSSGDLFVGAGLSGLFDFNNNWFIEGSVAPGFFHESRPNNNLGSSFEIRSLLGAGYQLQSGDRISIAITHKSNAGVSGTNPGVNAVLLRYRHSF